MLSLNFTSSAHTSQNPKGYSDMCIRVSKLERVPLSPLLKFLTTVPRDLKTTLQERCCVSLKAKQYPVACGFNVCSKLLYIITFSVNWDLKLTLALRDINHVMQYFQHYFQCQILPYFCFKIFNVICIAIILGCSLGL